MSEVLLICYMLVDGHQHLKPFSFGCGENFTIRQAFQARIAAGFAPVSFEMVTQGLVYALVQQDSHLPLG